MLPNRPPHWILDGSALINLAAMPDPRAIIDALGVPSIAPDISAREVKRLRRPELRNTEPLEFVRRLVGVVSLSESELDIFGEFAGRDGLDDLGDGESAVLAIAISRGGACVLDDAKPIRLATSQRPPIRTCSTVGLLRLLWEENSVDHELISVSIVDALHGARMRVPEEHLNWVAAIVPLEIRASLRSLPKRIRG